MLCALPYAQVGRIGTHEQNAMKDIVVYFVDSRRGSRKCFKGGGGPTLNKIDSVWRILVEVHMQMWKITNFFISSNIGEIPGGGGGGPDPPPPP